MDVGSPVVRRVPLGTRAPPFLTTVVGALVPPIDMPVIPEADDAPMPLDVVPFFISAS